MDHRTEHHHDGCCQGARNSRRSFLKLAALGAGVSLLTPVVPGAARASGGIEALLLTCMDYRLLDDVSAYMHSRNLTKQYDHIILAGASLGALTDKKPAWGEEFWDHVNVAHDLHNIKKVIVIDHRDCGAYKVFLGADLKDDPAKETEVHSAHLKKLGAMIKQKHPELEVELHLMGLDGKVEDIAA